MGWDTKHGLLGDPPPAGGRPWARLAGVASCERVPGPGLLPQRYFAEAAYRSDGLAARCALSAAPRLGRGGTLAESHPWPARAAVATKAGKDGRGIEGRGESV